MEHELYAKIGVSKIDIGGVGVIALKKIPKGTYPFQRKNPLKGHWVQEEDLPKNLEERQHILGFCPLVSKANGKKCDSTMKLLGCSIQDVRHHLEKQFAVNMSWDNHGFSGWHIDHIKPCASFDLTKEDEQRKCFHYTNLQPLWAKENLQKGKR